MKAQGTVELALGSSKDLSFNGPALSNPMPPISSFLEKTSRRPCSVLSCRAMLNLDPYASKCLLFDRRTKLVADEALIIEANIFQGMDPRVYSVGGGCSSSSFPFLVAEP